MPFSGNNLRDQREAQGLRMEALAGKADISLAALRNYESGRVPKVDVAERLAAALDVPLSDLLDGIERSAATLNARAGATGPITDPVAIELAGRLTAQGGDPGGRQR